MYTSERKRETPPPPPLSLCTKYTDIDGDDSDFIPCTHLLCNMPSTPIAREPLSALLRHTMETAEAASKIGFQNTIHPRGLLQPRRGQADSNGITRTENIILVITIVLFLALMLSFIWYLMSTGKEMNDLGGIGAARGKPALPTSAATAPTDPPEQKSVTEKVVEVDPDSSSAASARESVSESDKYWLWWTRRANKMEDEEAATGPQSRNRSPESH